MVLLQAEISYLPQGCTRPEAFKLTSLMNVENGAHALGNHQNSTLLARGRDQP
jgi:hypothetical protein